MLAKQKWLVMPKEFTVTADEDGNFALSLQPEMDYDIRIEKPGYMDRTTFISTKGMDPGTLTMEAILASLQEDTSMYKIFYDYDDSRIRSYAYKELDKVVDYMNRNPEVKIRLVSHADARGTTYYNDRLSKDRTMASYEYLRMEGIDKDRLELVWVGERKASYDDCGGVPCSEDEYQQDRRTDIEFAGVRELPDAPVIEMPALGENDTTMVDSMANEVVKEERSEEGGEDDGEGEEVVKEEAEDPEMPDDAPESEVVKEEATDPGTSDDTPETEVVKEEGNDSGTSDDTPETEVVEEEGTDSETPEGEMETPDPEVVEEGNDAGKMMSPENEGTTPDGSSNETSPTEVIEKVVDDAIEEMESTPDSARSIEIEVTPHEN